VEPTDLSDLSEIPKKVKTLTKNVNIELDEKIVIASVYSEQADFQKRPRNIKKVAANKPKDDMTRLKEPNTNVDFHEQIILDIDKVVISWI
jgi:DNA polymerase III delta prime subunit